MSDLNPATTLPQNGARVRLTVDVERFPFFIPKGATGTVEIQPDIVSGEYEVYAVRLDEPLEGAKWIHWYLANGDDPSAELEAIEEES